MCAQNVNIEKYNSRLMKDMPFTILLNDVIQQIQDLELLGLYSYLASLPTEWVINKEHLKSHFQIGTKKIESLFRKLIHMGLLLKEEFREKGRYVGVNYRLCLGFHRSAENGATVNGATAKEVHINNIYNKKINNKEIKEKEIYKEKENKPLANKSPIIQFLLSNNPFSFDEDTLKGYLEMRKSIKKPLTERAWLLLMKEIQKAVAQGFNPLDCINEAILRSWQGFKCEWLQRHSEVKIIQPRASEMPYNRKETVSTVPFFEFPKEQPKKRTDGDIKTALSATKSILSKLRS